MKISLVIRLLAFLTLLLIMTTSYTGTNALFALLLLPLFFLGRPWYSYLKKK